MEQSGSQNHRRMSTPPPPPPLSILSQEGTVHTFRKRPTYGSGDPEMSIMAISRCVERVSGA